MSTSSSSVSSAIMADFWLTWTLSGPGWADCAVGAEETQARVPASYITSAPEEFLTAVARLVLGEAETRAQFEAEPTAFRWIFQRQGDDVSIRLLESPDGRTPDKNATQIWSTQQHITAVARAVIRCFDDVAEKYGESGYRGEWRKHFPRSELEALRAAWREQPPNNA
jgi:hypothetical protein